MKGPMNIASVERLILINQYEILRRVNPAEAADYEVILESLRWGYDHDFEALAGVDTEPLNDDIHSEVRQILDMFRVLGPRDGGDVPARALFAGFDGHGREGSYQRYASFLIETRGLWQESRRNLGYDTHEPMLGAYRAMLDVMRRTGKKLTDLSEDDLQSIAAVAPRSCIP
jgi:uncharacterized protein YfbU (UPF0304 family)